MNAIEYIKDNTDAITILDYYGFKNVKETDYQIRACCAIHGGDNPEAFIWNKENDLWFCYTGDCGGGDVFDLIMKMEKLSFKDAVAKAAYIFGLTIDGMKIGLSENRLRNEQKMWLKIQLERLNSTEPREVEINEVYTKKNGNTPVFWRYKEETYETFDAVCVDSITLDGITYTDKCAIPIYKNGKIICFGLRDMTGSKEIPKWLYHPRGVKLSNELYKFEDIMEEYIENDIDEIILVEGMFDAWSLYEIGIPVGVAVFGSNISKEQYKKLMKANVNLVFCFDNDDAGRKCTRKAIEMFKNKVNYTVMELPEGKDPGDCTPEELMNAYLQRR